MEPSSSADTVRRRQRKLVPTENCQLGRPTPSGALSPGQAGLGEDRQSVSRTMIGAPQLSGTPHGDCAPPSWVPHRLLLIPSLQVNALPAASPPTQTVRPSSLRWNGRPAPPLDRNA